MDALEPLNGHARKHVEKTLKALAIDRDLIKLILNCDSQKIPETLGEEVFEACIFFLIDYTRGIAKISGFDQEEIRIEVQTLAEALDDGLLEKMLEALENKQ